MYKRRVRAKTDGKDDQIIGFFPDVMIRCGIANAQGIIFRVGNYPGDHGSYIADIIFGYGSLIETIKSFAVGPDVNIKNSGTALGCMLPGDHGLFGGGHATHGGTILLTNMTVPGTDTLNPGDAAGIFTVGNALNMSLEWTGCRKNSFVFQAGDDIGPASVAVFPFYTRIKRLKSSGQNHGPCIQPDDFIFLIKRDGLIFTNLFANAAFSLCEIAAALFINGIYQGNRLRIGNINGFALV